MAKKIINKLKVEDVKVPKKAIIRQTIENEISLQRTQQDLANWRQAVISAENIINPYRVNLYRGYKDGFLDTHVNAVWNARKAEILGTKFNVVKKGKIQPEQTDIIQRKWFFDFINHALDSKMWGYSLVQFGNIQNSEFTAIDLVPRVYVRPELNLVVKYMGGLTGDDYTQKPFSDWCLGIGERLDLGLMMMIMPLYLWKKTAMTSWAEYCQIFGVPARVLKTDTSDIVALRNGQRMVKEMGSSLGAVIDKEDELQIIESKSSSVGDTFLGLINLCNAEISKIVLGESSSMDPKAFVGSAKIHQETKSQMIQQDIVWLENIFKYQLVPFLNSHGFGFENCEIKIEKDQELTIEEKTTVLTSILKYYDVPAEYMMENFGIPVSSRTPTGTNEIIDNYNQSESGDIVTPDVVKEETNLDESPVRKNWSKEIENKLQIHNPKKRK